MILNSLINWFLLFQLFISLFIAVSSVVSVLPVNAIAADSKFTSKYTSIQDIDCWETSRHLTVYYDKRQLDANECHGIRGWRLFTVFDRTESWIEIAAGKNLWSTETVVKNESKNGISPYLVTDKTEWIIDASGTPYALLFRIGASSKTAGLEPKKYYVIKLTNNSPRFCGIASSVKKARYLADSKTDCIKELSKQVIPDLINTYNPALTIESIKHRKVNLSSKNASFRNQHMFSGKSSHLPKPLSRYLNKYNYFTNEYISPEGWHLFYMSSPDYSWFDISHDRRVWSTEGIIISSGPAAELINRIQWRMDNSGKPKALILRVTYQNTHTTYPRLSRLLIISLKDDTPKYCGEAKTNIEAKNIADKAINCNHPLSVKFKY